MATTLKSENTTPTNTTTTTNQIPLTTAALNTSQIPLTAAASNVPSDAVSHLVDITKSNTQQDTGIKGMIVIPEITYFIYMSRAIRNLLVTFVFDWSIVILHPLTFISSITLVPILLFVLLVLEGIFRIGYRLGAGNIITNISNKWGEGLSMANWWDPRIFSDDVKPIVEAGISALNQSPPPPLKEEDLDNDMSVQTLSFNINIAELLLFMSSIVYERNDDYVREAHNEITRLTDNKRDVSKLTTIDFETIYNKLRDSEERIHQQASSWDLKFTSLSELNSLGGPFSGIFYSEEHNFIVVVFKGTTPTNFEDFIVDLMLQRTDARDFVFGEVHEGFYTSLFPQAENTSSRSNNVSSYFTIIRAIRAKAADILNAQKTKSNTKDQNEGKSQDESMKKINVWVTGHSLGGALATLFFSRCLKAKNDLGPNCILRDAYVFGSPALGDNDFAAGFSDCLNRTFDQRSVLWRVIDDTDIIARLNGFEDLTIRRALNRYSLLNYVHVGEGIRFFQDGRRPESLRKIFSSGKEPIIVERFEEDDDKNESEFHEAAFNSMNSMRRKVRDVFENSPLVRKEGNPLDFMETLLPTFFRNHLPARYFEVMQKARKYFDENKISVNDDASLINSNIINDSGSDNSNES